MTSDRTAQSGGAHSSPGPRRWLTGRHTSAAVIGVLTLLLGFAIAVQVHAHSSNDSLANLSENDLIGILDNQNVRAERLRGQIAALEQDLEQLRDSGDRAAAARQQARQEADALAILLGTKPATGPGISVTITDPDGALGGEDLLGVVEELRGAGAEAIQFGNVRVSTDTAFEGSPGSVRVDGVEMRAPYRLLAIGAAKSLDTALNIPGGAAAVIRAAGGELTAHEHAKVTISATRELPDTPHATPSR